VIKTGDVIKPKGSTLRLRANGDGTFTDQFGRVLEAYTNEHGKPDYRPTGSVDPNGASH
jgi:hypothetical protein